MIVHEVEQRSPDWYALRLGKPTASEFSKIVTSKGEPSKSAATYAMTLAAEAFAGAPIEGWEGNVWTDRGNQMQGDAERLYEFTRDATITPVGFITTDDKSMGCSPDGLIGDDGMVEIKCLKAETHIKAVLYYQKHGRCPPDYVQQTQGQLMICERAWCDLLFFHPELPPLIIRQEPDQKMHDALRGEIAKLVAERDRVIAALREQQTGTSEPDPVDLMAAG